MPNRPLRNYDLGQKRAITNRDGAQGFTLLELIITIAIFSIIAGVAIPGFQNLIETNRVTTQTNNFLSALKTARSEAVKRGGPVTVSAIGGDFGTGWCLYEGTAGSDCDSVTTIRSVELGSKSGISIDSGGTNAIEFDDQGRLTSPNNEVEIAFDPTDCDEDEGEGKRREVSIGFGGRASSSRGDCD